MASAQISVVSSAPAWAAHRVTIFNGQHDTHIETGEDYATISLAEVFALPPAARDKRYSPACIPSSYCGHDAREHARQRDAGSFVALCGDVDRGDHDADAIVIAVESFCDDAAWLVYSSAHAREGDMRWRIVIPLSVPVSFADWYDAQNAFFTFMESAGIEMDHALDRAAQPVYLPNVPAIHAKSNNALRDAGGNPVYYHTASSGLGAPGLSIDRGVVCGGIAAIRRKRDLDDAERDRIRRAAQHRRSNRPTGDGQSIIADFNAANSVSAMLGLCGYEQSLRDDRDWRSPLQTGDTFATRVMDEKWVSLSASDAAAGVGEKCQSGCYGDAYDLFVHYKHGGDHKAAFRELHAERRPAHPNVDRGGFAACQPDVDGDPGWQEMPDWAHARRADAQGVANEPAFDSPPADVRTRVAPLRERFDAADVYRHPGTATATPYAWRDPASILPRQWIYGRSIQRGHVRAIVAPGAAGKTIFSIGEALAMVTGRNLLGQDVPGGPKRVWLWNLEDDMEELSRSIQAACKHWRIEEADLANRLFVDSAMEGAILKLATSTVAEGFRVNRPLVEALIEEMNARQIDYLHVDPFVSSHAANESDNGEIDAIAKEWALVAKKTGAAIGLAHHVSKAGAIEVKAHSARGAVSLPDACRSVLTLNRMSEDEAKRYGVEGERRRRFFRVYDDKNNRAPPSDESDWYSMISVDLGNGSLGAGDNMGVVVPWSPPDAFDGITVDHLVQVQRLVGAGEYRESSQASDWVGRAVAEALGLSAERDATADRARINSLLRTWFANGALVVVEKRDTRKRENKRFVEVGERALQDTAPPHSSGAGQGGASGAPQAPRPTCPPLGAGVGQSAAQVAFRVGRGRADGHDLDANEIDGEHMPGWEDVS